MLQEDKIVVEVIERASRRGHSQVDRANERHGDHDPRRHRDDDDNGRHGAGEEDGGAHEAHDQKGVHRLDILREAVHQAARGLHSIGARGSEATGA